MTAANRAKRERNWGIRFTHQMFFSRSGTAAMRGANWKLSPLEALSRRLTTATSTNTPRNSTNCTSPVSVV
jgi:hypothetical protein